MTKTRTPKDNENKSIKEKIQKQYEDVFLEESARPTHLSLRQVEALQSRVAELEAKLAQQPPAEAEDRLAPVKEMAMQVKASQQGARMTEEPASTEDKQKQMALWISGTFVAITSAFFGFAMYALLVLQGGSPDSSDPYLIPFTAVMVLLTLIGHMLIRRDRVAWGSWIVYLLDAILFPILMVLFLEGIYVVSGAYLAILAFLFIAFVIPRTSKWNAIVSAVVAALAIVAIELWQPAFRVKNNHLETLIPFLFGLSLLVILIYLVRSAFSRNIRTKLITAFLAIALVSTGIVAVLAQRSLSTNLTENIGMNLGKLANTKAIEIGQTVDREADILKALALSKDIGEAVASANRSNLLSQSEIQNFDNEWRAADAANENTDALVASVLDNNISNELRHFQQEFPHHVEVFLTNRQGVNIAATNRTSDYYQADEKWWQTAYQEGVYLGQPAYDESSKTFAITMATAIRQAGNGETLGVLRTTVSLVTLADSLTAGQFGQTGHTSIYLPNGQELALQMGDDGSHELGLKDASPDIHLLGQSTAPYMEITHDGMPALASHALATVLSDEEEDDKAINNLNWHIVVLQDRSEALQPVTIQTRNILVIVILVSIAVILLAFVLAGLISTPLIGLNTVAAKIASGDLTARAKVETRDEIGMLATTFNNMTAQLGELFESLEQRVLERTHDLELATEVGRAVSEKVGDLDEMLFRAAELIRTRFNLYYTQIYLVDSSGKMIVLHAGTGEVGKELLQREHRLPINASSLNGRATMEKRAVIVADTNNHPGFLRNPLLPNTRSEMSIPLIVGGKVVGVLDMQSEEAGSLNESNLPAFEALAGQLAIAVENATLFSQTQEARAEVEAHIRLLTEHGWQEFLDAIERAQRIGFAFQNSKIVRLQPDALAKNGHDLSIPIAVTGTKIGEIMLPVEQDQPWTEAELELIKATSAQLAQHIENLRLLAQGDRYRAQAEQAIRRLTREGWDNYIQLRANETPGYIYDLTEVQPFTTKGNGHSRATFTQPLLVHGETIGELAVDGIEDQAQQMEIITAVADQLSKHIENLRLTEETERRSSELASVAGQLSEALDIARLANWEYDVKRDRFIFNDHFYSIFHTTVEQVGGYEVSSAEYAQRFVHPDDVPMVGQAIAKALSSTDRHYNVHLEHRILFADGGVGYISVDVHIERDEQGNILRYYGANQDITERKKAEEILRVSEARLSEALNIAKLANWEYDLEKDVFTFNDQFYSIFHTTVDKVGGYELSSAQYAQLFVHPDDAALVGEEIGKAIASTDRHYTKQIEHRILFADGGLGYLSVDVNIERDENGKITRWYGANQDITERKKAEEELLKVRLGMDRANDAVFMTDINGSIVYVNPAFERIYGWTKEEAIGQTPRLIKSGLIPLEQYKEFWNHLLKNETVTGELTNKTKDGRLIPIEASNNAIVDGKGQIIGFIGLHRDITERKLAEETIKKEQKRTQAILESVTVPMVITRLSDNHLTFVNSPALEVTQFKYEDVINQPAPDFYSNPEDRKNFITILRAKGEVSDMVVQLRRGNGEVFWALLSARVFDYQSEASILTTFMDISERIRAEEAIAKRATELAAVANVSTAASTLLNPDQLLQSVVDLTRDYFGLYHAHIYLADESWQTLLLAAGAGEVGQKMVAEGWNISLDHQSSIVADTARTRKPVIANDVYHDKDSSFLSNRLLPDTRSEMAVPIIVGEKLLGVFDVQSTETGRFTDEDANIYITLASQIGVALQNARLYMEQAATLTQLRELDKLKSSFLANMSHELRTPLNSILGFTDVMLEELDGPLTEHMDNDLRLIQKNGQHLLHLINDVLDMAKIEAGRMNLNPETFKVHEVLEEVTNITSTLANEKHLPLVIEDCSDQNIEIYADRTRFRQVMINLVNNAIKFTDKGQVALKVSPMDGARVSITVKDTGIGIPSDNLETIFQEFTQVDSSTTRKTGGTGLGLPISRRLVEMHGGRVWAESVGMPGEGSTLFVELPVEARITDIIEKQAK